ncbi:DUF427 domain-containing protein [Altererythrobacter sp.]|nr:DUF427 domain-containing protein [Altererythrobacter sp.]
MTELPDKQSLLAQVKQHRNSWSKDFRPPGIEKAGEGEESVWDYPRPPRADPSPDECSVRRGKLIIASSANAVLVRETAGAPCPYFPPEDVQEEWLVANGRVSVCEWKGAAVEFDLVVPGCAPIVGAAWTYPEPFDDLAEGYAAIAGWYAFYPAKLACFVGEEQARAQPGGLYGGWVTGRIKGPIKGGPGTGYW